MKYKNLKIKMIEPLDAILGSIIARCETTSKPIAIINLNVDYLENVIQELKEDNIDYIDLIIFGSDKPICFGEQKGIIKKGIFIAPRTPVKGDERILKNLR